MNLFSGSLFLVLVMLAELVLLKYWKKDNIPWREIVYNVNSGHILMWIFRGLEVYFFYLVLTNYSLHLLDSWGFAAQWFFTFLAWDFCFYTLHYFHHKIPLFWMVHVVHHKGEHFSLSLGLRNSWYSSLTSIPFFLLLAVIGVPMEVFVSVSAIHYFVQFYNHNGIVGKSGFLEYFMITPARHRVHHGLNPEYVDTNFGGTLNIWDRIFGTLQPELENVPIIYGVKDAVVSDNPLWGNNIPFMEAMHIKVPAFKKGKEQKFIVPDMYIATGGLSLLNLWLYYIFCQFKGLEVQQFWFFLLIFFGTISLGFLSDGEYKGMISWVIMTIVPSLLFVLYFHIFEPAVLLLFIIHILHGLYGMKWLFSPNTNKELRSSGLS